MRKRSIQRTTNTTESDINLYISLDTFQNDKHLSIGIALADNPVKFTQIYTLYNVEKKVLT
jgi:hypothetical protein